VDYVNNPFAFADLTGKTADGTYDATNAQVSCLSCHRAHGTPYSDILRWDYDTQTAGGGATYGCLGCHNNQR
jgi:predicted CXXCH cytochrome family protein